MHHRMHRAENARAMEQHNGGGDDGQQHADDDDASHLIAYMPEQAPEPPLRLQAQALCQRRPSSTRSPGSAGCAGFRQDLPGHLIGLLTDVRHRQ